MTYNKTQFIKDSLSVIATGLIITGLCFLFGWSSLFLFFALVTATEAVKLPLTLIIRGLFSREKAVFLESILLLTLTVIMAQQLFVASCIKLFVLTAIIGAYQALGLLGAVLFKEGRDELIKNMYGDEEGAAPTAGVQRGPVNEPFAHPSQLASNSISQAADNAALPSYQEAVNANSPEAQAEAPEASMRRTAARS